MNDLIERIRRLREPGAAPDPTVIASLARCDDAAILAEAGRLLAGVPAAAAMTEDQTARPLRVALAATFTADGVAPLLRALLLAAGIDATLHVCPFNQLIRELSDPDSGLASFCPDVTFGLLHDGALLSAGWNPLDLPAVRATADAVLDQLEAALAGFVARMPGTVVLHTVPLSPTEHRTVIDYRNKARLGRLWRELNARLLELADRHPGTYVLDFEAVVVDGSAPVRDERLYRFACMAWTSLTELSFAREAVAFCRALVGRSRKVLALDLDGTLWGGVVGDDGPAGIALGPLYPGNCYTEVQRRAKALQRQGVLLVGCTKNEPAVVDELLTMHPEMVLRGPDFVTMAASWQHKDASLRTIADELNLGLDSFVFADDSRFEADLVAAALPEVTVVHLAGDPAGHVTKLLAGRHFDVLTSTDEDRARTALYHGRITRSRSAQAYGSAEEFLRDLDLRVTVRPVDQFTLPRLVQLAARTNQFNLAGRAHSEAETRRMAASPEHLVLAFDAADRFGSEGIVGGVWIVRHGDNWWVENFVMSCRVMSRGVERAVLQHVIDRATAAGAGRVLAAFRATGRNLPAAAVYPDAGFIAVDVPTADIETTYERRLPASASITPDWITVVEDTADA